MRIRCIVRGLTVACLFVVSSSCTASDGDGQGEGEGEGEGELTDASAVEALCARIDECSAQDPGACEVAFRNQLVQLRNQGRAPCTQAADAIQAGYVCASEQSCEVAVGGFFAWSEVCPDIAAGRTLIDTCNGVVAEGEGEGEREYPCNAAFAFDLPDPARAPGVAVDAVAGVFDDQVPPECEEFFGRSAGALVTMQVTGDASLVSGGMFGIDDDPSDGSGANALVAFTVVDDTTVTAFACLDELLPVEMAVQLFLSNNATTFPVCGNITAP